MNVAPPLENHRQTARDKDLITVNSICEGLKMFQLLIKLLILFIFLGYMMIWIMMPTNVFWLHWLPRIQGTIVCTFFGDQGSVLLQHNNLDFSNKNITLPGTTSVVSLVCYLINAFIRNI